MRKIKSIKLLKHIMNTLSRESAQNLIDDLELFDGLEAVAIFADTSCGDLPDNEADYCFNSIMATDEIENVFIEGGHYIDLQTLKYEVDFSQIYY